MASAAATPPALQQFIDEELLRAPLVAEQMLDGVVDRVRKGMAALSSYERQIASDLVQALSARRSSVAEAFTESLRATVAAGATAAARRPAPGLTLAPAGQDRLSGRSDGLALVDEHSVVVDVELSRVIEEILAQAEHELRELKCFVAALAGDMDVSADHSPFTPEAYARAVWYCAQALPLSRGYQAMFMRHAAPSLAQVLRKSFAAACTRLEASGVEPASYRTIIYGTGQRRYSLNVGTETPDLHRMREAMQGVGAEEAAAPMGLEPPPAPQAPAVAASAAIPPGAVSAAAAGSAAMGATTAPPSPAPVQRWTDIARQAGSRGDRQAVELVGRLFEAILAHTAIAPDVIALISRLHGPAMRLTLHDPRVLDKDSHPLWQFIHMMVFEAQMRPHATDPERMRWMRFCQLVIDAVAADLHPSSELYDRALQRLQDFRARRLERRLAAASEQVETLQRMEDRLGAGYDSATTVSGMVDLPSMDTVPAQILSRMSAMAPSNDEGEQWLQRLTPGTWVRMFISGRWVHAQLLWPGERGELWLFCDGASTATWAIRRAALSRMRTSGLAKTLQMRSLVGAAAIKVQEEISAQVPAAAPAPAEASAPAPLGELTFPPLPPWQGR